MSSNTQESVPDASQKSVTDWLMQVISRKEPAELNGHEPGHNGNGAGHNGNGNGAVHEEARVNPLFVKTENGKGNLAVAEPARTPAIEITADDLCGPPACGPVPRALRDEITADDLCWVPKIEARNGAVADLPPATTEFTPSYEPQVAQTAADAPVMAAATQPLPEPEPIFVAQQVVPDTFAAAQPPAAETATQAGVEVSAQPIFAEAHDVFAVAQPPVMAEPSSTVEVPDVFGMAPTPVVEPAAAPEIPDVFAQATTIQPPTAAEVPDVFAQPAVTAQPKAPSEADDVFGIGHASVTPPAVTTIPVAFSEPFLADAPAVAEVVTLPPAVVLEPERADFAAQQVAPETLAPTDFMSATPVAMPPAEAELIHEPLVATAVEMPIETPAPVSASQMQAMPEIQPPDPIQVAPEIEAPVPFLEPLQAQAAPEIQTPLHVPEPVQAQAPAEIEATPQSPAPELSGGLAKIPQAPPKRGKRGKRERAVSVADICRDWVLEEMMERDPGALLAGAEPGGAGLEELQEGEEEPEESVFAREGIWGEGDHKEIADGAPESALALADDGTEIDGDPRSSAVKTLLHMGSMLPWLARESPGSDARNKQSIALTQEVRQEVAGMRLVQHEIRSTVHDHSMQLKRVEDQLTRVRETLVDEADGTADLVTSVKSTTRTVQVVGIGVCALLGFVLVMVMLLFLRR